MYGKRRSYPKLARRDRDFRNVLQIYCRRSARVCGAGTVGSCPAQIFIKKHRRCSGWQMTWKGIHNHVRLNASEKPRRYDNLIARIWAEEERTQVGAGMERQLNIATRGPVVEVTDATDGENITERGQGVVGAVSVDVASVINGRIRGHVDQSGHL